LGWSSGFNLKYFKHGNTLTKDYIIHQMIGNAEYGNYVPDKSSPKLLSREFLLAVNIFI